MSLEQRSTIFKTHMLAKNQSLSPNIFYATRYQRLILTRRVAELIISSLLVFGGQQFLIQNTFFSPIWLAAGVGLSAIFLRGNFLLCGIFLGTLTSYLYNHIPWTMSCFQALLFTAYIYFIRYTALHLIGPVTPLAKLSILSKFIALILLLSAIHVSILFYLLSPRLFQPTFFNWYVAWLGEVNGILCLTPLCLMFDPFVSQHFFRIKAWRWWVASLGIISAHFLYFLVNTHPPSIIFSLFSLLVMSSYAYAFGQIPTGITLLGISVIYLSGVLSPTQLFNAALSQWDVEVILTLFTLTAIISLAVATYRGIFTLKNPPYSLY